MRKLFWYYRPQHQKISAMSTTRRFGTPIAGCAYGRICMRGKDGIACNDRVILVWKIRRRAKITNYKLFFCEDNWQDNFYILLLVDHSINTPASEIGKLGETIISRS